MRIDLLRLFLAAAILFSLARKIDVLEFYFKQCSIAMHCRHLAQLRIVRSCC